jgi:hypothetical protein
MPEPFDPRPEEANRERKRAAATYAVVALLLLAACCVGVFWFSTFLRQLVAELT